MSSRMANPAMIIPEAMEPIQQLYVAAGKGGVPGPPSTGSTSGPARSTAAGGPGYRMRVGGWRSTLWSEVNEAAIGGGLRYVVAGAAGRQGGLPGAGR